MYQYRAEVLRVIDGDTVELVVDLGFNIRHIIRGRLLDVDAPEIFRGTLETKEKGERAANFLRKLLGDIGPTVLVNTHKDKMTFNRWVVELRDGGNQSINAQVAAFCATLP